MNLAALQSDLYRRLGLPSSPATATVDRLLAFINETQQEICSEPGMMDILLEDSVTFASVASRAEYGLPPIVSRIKYIRDTTNRRLLQPMSVAEYKNEYPSPTSFSNSFADFYVDLGFTPVNLQPSNASELFFISTSASDGATKSVTVEGYTTGGYFRSATVAMNGITGVSLGSSITDWIEVTKFEIVLGAGGTTTAAGTITLREDSAVGTVLATIPIGQAFSRMRKIALVPTPSSAITYTVDFERELTDMANATDEPVIPLRFHRMLVTGARRKEYEKTDSTRYVIADREFERARTNLLFWVHTQAIGQPNMRGRTSEAPSRLGPWFPSLG